MSTSWKIKTGWGSIPDITAAILDSERDREWKHSGQNVNVNNWSNWLYRSYLYNPCNFSVSLKLSKESVIKVEQNEIILPTS